MSDLKLLTEWVIDNPPLTKRQKIAMGSSLVLSVLSTLVCAPMGRKGAQALFGNEHELASWPFFFLSPILILLLSGRGAYRFSKFFFEEKNSKFEALFQAESPLSIRLFKLLGFSIFSLISGAVNAYNTFEYLPSWLVMLCVGPALIIPGFVMVPAFVEYHQKLWFFLNYVWRGENWRQVQERKPEAMLKKNERYFRQLPPEERQRLNAVFSHPCCSDPLRLLFFPASKQVTFFDKPKMAYGLAVVGFVIGTLAEFFSYRFGRNITSSWPEFLSIIFGVMLSYVRMGISGVATSEVFSGFYDDVHHSIRTGNKTMSHAQIVIRVFIVLFAIAGSLTNLQNQIKTMGHESVFGKILSACAIIAPTCLYFWAGDLVLRDWQYDAPGVSYHACLDKLFAGLPSLKKNQYQKLEAEMALKNNSIF